MDDKNQILNEPSGNKRVSTRIKAAACIGFLALSIVLWIISGGSWLVWLLLLIPCFLCEEWLADKISLQGSGLSIAESGFSILRIVYGVLLVLLFFGVIYGLTLIGGWFF